MKKKAKIWIRCIVAVAVFVIAGVVYVSSRLPDGFGIDKLIRGVIATDVQNKPYTEVSSNEFFFKDGNLDAVIEHLADRSMMFNEQFGEALIFTYEEATVEASLQAITRWHLLLTIDDIGATTAPDI